MLWWLSLARVRWLEKDKALVSLVLSVGNAHNVTQQPYQQVDRMCPVWPIPFRFDDEPHNRSKPEWLQPTARGS